MLRTLEISLQAQEADSPTQVTAFADAPQLREVYLSDFTLPLVTLPWTQLTSLRLSGQDYAQCVEILRQTTNLETLNVDYLHSPAMPPPPVRLNHLQTLIVGGQFPLNTDLFEYIIFPALTHLELTDVADGMVPHITDFLTRSACRLSSLTLIGTQLRLALACLRAAPMATLRTVRVVDADWDQSQLNHVFTTLTRDSATFLPNLRSIAVNPCTTAVKIPYLKLADLLAARRGAEGSGVARLDSLELILAPSTPFPAQAVTIAAAAPLYSEDGLDALRALAADGVNIRIRGLHATSSVPW
ncbi:hypothetical protein B0H11DRAFT_943020 [Mycena galericulata]|nr:hypothetical protein B0H11DRAFT_943020 [Mycena galericulata]